MQNAMMSSKTKDDFKVSVSSLTLGTLYEAILAFSSQDSFDTFWPSVCQNARWVMPFRRMGILINRGEETFEIVGQFEQGKFLKPTNLRYQASSNKLGNALLKRNAQWFTNPLEQIEEAMDPFHQWLFQGQPETLFVLPIRVKTQNIGALILAMGSIETTDQTMVTSLGTVYVLHVGMTYTLIQLNEERRKKDEELQAAHRKLAESEKMVALGQLIAGIAHEINTPLGVIRASIGNISHALDETLQQLPKIFHELPLETLDTFFALLKRAQESPLSLSTKEERKNKRVLITQLQSEAVEDADEIADTLVDMGIYDKIEPFLPLFKTGTPSVLASAYNLSSLQKNSQNIFTAVERSAKVVFALKKFVHQDHSDQKIPVDLTDGIETVLTIYHHQLKQGVELSKHYQELPQVMCYPDELNQVWTNLIHNALQSMAYKGRLEIEVSQVEEQAVIKFTDNGPGIPEEIKKRIFDPFFTTKPTGEGSGLGLDISKKIIEKHQGSINVESEPGRTMFRVSIPIE